MKLIGERADLDQLANNFLIIKILLIKMAVAKLKDTWLVNVINKDIDAILKCYSRDAVFKGTMMLTAVKDKKEIKHYFTLFAPNVVNIKFGKAVHIKKDNIVTEMGAYKFYTKDGVIKANYSMVFETKDKKAKIISHFSSVA